MWRLPVNARRWRQHRGQRAALPADMWHLVTCTLSVESLMGQAAAEHRPHTRQASCLVPAIVRSFRQDPLVAEDAHLSAQKQEASIPRNLRMGWAAPVCPLTTGVFCMIVMTHPSQPTYRLKNYRLQDSPWPLLLTMWCLHTKFNQRSSPTNPEVFKGREDDSYSLKE